MKLFVNVIRALKDRESLHFFFKSNIITRVFESRSIEELFIYIGLIKV